MLEIHPFWSGTLEITGTWYCEGDDEADNDDGDDNDDYDDDYVDDYSEDIK